jgi:hypothetical protein
LKKGFNEDYARYLTKPKKSSTGVVLLLINIKISLTTL